MIPTNQALTKAQNKPSNITWFEKDLLTPHCVRKALWGVVASNTGNPILVDWATKIIRQKNVAERDEKGLARAVQQWVQDNIKYFREDPERFASPLRTIAWNIGDCDDKSTLIASVLRSFKIPTRLKIITFKHYSKKEKREKTFCHVYPQVKINDNIYALESVHKWPLGVDAEDLLKMKKIKVDARHIGDF